MYYTQDWKQTSLKIKKERFKLLKHFLKKYLYSECTVYLLFLMTL